MQDKVTYQFTELQDCEETANKIIAFENILRPMTPSEYTLAYFQHCLTFDVHNPYLIRNYYQASMLYRRN